MKYAIPVLNDNGWDTSVGEHFGRVPLYCIWDDESDTIVIIPNASNHFGGVGMPAEFLATKADGIICKGIGAKAIDLCNNLGLKLYVGAPDTVRETVRFMKEGKLPEATRKDGCSH